MSTFFFMKINYFVTRVYKHNPQFVLRHVFALTSRNRFRNSETSTWLSQCLLFSTGKGYAVTRLCRYTEEPELELQPIRNLGARGE